MAWQRRTYPCWRPSTWWRRVEANWPWRSSGMTVDSWSASQKWRTAPRTAIMNVAKTAAQSWMVRESIRGERWRNQNGEAASTYFMGEIKVLWSRSDPVMSLMLLGYRLRWINSRLSCKHPPCIAWKVNTFSVSVSHQKFQTLMRTFEPTGHVQPPKRGGHAGTDFTLSPRLVKTKSTDVMHKKTLIFYWIWSKSTEEIFYFSHRTKAEPPLPKSRDQSPVRSTLSRPPVKAYAPRRGQSCRELLCFILFIFLCRSTKMLVLKPALIFWFSNCWLLFIQLRLNLSPTTVHLLRLLQSGERGTGTAWTKPTNTSQFTRMISLKWPRFILLKYIYITTY